MEGRGITLIEALLAIAVAGAVAAAAAPTLVGLLTRSGLDRFAGEAVFSLREAQASAMNGRFNAGYGVRFDQAGARFTFFKGQSFAARDAEFDEEHPLDAGVVIDSFTGCTDPCDILYLNRFGTTGPAARSVVFKATATGETRTVTVQTSGLADW